MTSLCDISQLQVNDIRTANYVHCLTSVSMCVCVCGGGGGGGKKKKN